MLFKFKKIIQADNTSSIINELSQSDAEILSELSQSDAESKCWLPPRRISIDKENLPIVHHIQPIQPNIFKLFIQYIFEHIIKNFYKKYLKRFLILRKFLSYLNYIRIKFLDLIMKVMDLFVVFNLSMVKVSVENSEKISVLINSNKIDTHCKGVFPAVNHSIFLAQDYYLFPEIYISKVEDAKVNGASNFIFKGSELLCHELYDFDSDYTSEELNTRLRLNTNENKAYWIKKNKDKNPTIINKAASFLDACAGNYAHWLTEVLPRICLFCQIKEFENIPIIINSGLHENIIESLAFIVGKERTVFTLPLRNTVTVNELYVVSPTGYIPFDVRPGKSSSHHGIFSKDALKILTSKVMSEINLFAPDYPQKIYLCRRSKVRQLINETEIEKLLVDNGFSVIDTANLSFQEQVILFNNAKVIVAPTGAACANLIFAKENAKVIILMSIHKNMPYKYWMHMANARGIYNISYVLGEIVNNINMDFHADYYIKPDDLHACLSHMEI